MDWNRFRKQSPNKKYMQRVIMDSEAHLLTRYSEDFGRLGYEWAVWQLVCTTCHKQVSSITHVTISFSGGKLPNKFQKIPSIHPSIHPSLHHLSGHYITPAQTIQYLRRTNSSRKYQHKFNICLICCAALQCRESFLMTFSWQTVSRLGKFKGQTWHKHTPYIDGTVLGTGPNGKILGPKMDRVPS